MSKNIDLNEDSELEQLIQSLLDEEEGSCLKCGFKMIQQYKVEPNTLTTEVKMRCHHCGHTALIETKLLS